MRLNNGNMYNFLEAEILTEFSKCTYFFPSTYNSNYLRGCYNSVDVLSVKISEENSNVDVIIQIPDNIECSHFYKGKISQEIIISRNSHLTYHGTAKKKKQSGETHLIVDKTNHLKGKSNRQESPVASSNDLSLFPLPICRFEFADIISRVQTSKEINNYFEILGPNCFFNTLDIYLAKSGFMTSILNCISMIPEIVISIFANTNLEGFKVGKLIRRRGRYPQVLVLQIKNFELILINMHEYNNTSYLSSNLYYFHSKDYLKTVSDRYALEAGKGFFVDSENYSKAKGGDFFHIIDKINCLPIE